MPEQCRRDRCLDFGPASGRHLSGRFDQTANARQAADAGGNGQRLDQVNDFIQKNAVQVSAERLSQLAGYYCNPDDGNLRQVQFKNDKLLFERGPGIATELAPIAQERFLMRGVPSKLEFSFETKWSDTRLLSISTGDGRPLVLVYVGADLTKPKQLNEYEGTYQNTDADATVALQVHDGKLVLCARHCEKPRIADAGPGRGWYPLESIGADSFKSEWMGRSDSRATLKTTLMVL